ncbi:MAG TPA: PAS domain-containing sensor histidine kinase [Gemmatimonadaceae bacterium]|nr:PAS domain-containing sensor histidine kinase [Gemmatimonadaceae bacterium]
MRDAIHAVDRAAMHRTLPPELFSGFLAVSADAVIAVDEDQRIIFFNQGAEQIFGWTADEVGGKYLAMLLPERYRPQHRGHVEGFGAAHGKARLMGERQQISGLRKSGEEFPAEASIQRMQVDGHNVYAAVLRDVSARQKAEDALRQAIQARDDMLGIVSHDLRNPANAVKMLAASILADAASGRVPEDIVERVRVMQQAAAQMDTLIQDLLDVTRIEAGRLRVSLRQVDPRLLVVGALEAMRPLAELAGVTLREHYDPDLPEVDADPERITQVLSNVVGNALKFTPDGGRVTIRVQRGGRGVIISVADTGEGIPPEQLPRIFDRFFQVASEGPNGPRHGAGLGLPIARGIVEAHGGSIRVESEPGSGSLVTIELPA